MTHTALKERKSFVGQQSVFHMGQPSSKKGYRLTLIFSQLLESRRYNAGISCVNIVKLVNDDQNPSTALINH